jgi:anti-sigma-K factor RskA
VENQGRDQGLHDLAAAYALDALDEADRRAFDDHLESCGRCREDVLTLAGAASALAYAAEGPVPPEALRGRVLAAVHAEPARAKVIRFPRARRSAWIASVAAAACLAIGLGLWATLGTGQSPGRAQTVALAGRVGTLTVNGSGQATMEVRNLGAPPRGSFYQVWVIPKGAKPIRDVRLPTSGRAQLGRTVSGGDTVAVTVEHAVVDAPTSSPIVTASLPA